MAYPRPLYDQRSPHDSERSRSSWDTLQRPHYPSMPSPSHHVIHSPSLFDPESESSDVSENPGDDYQTRIHSSFPTSLPPAPAKQVLDSLDAIESRLRELQRVEDHNITKRDQLKTKRARKDDRIRRKREAQDMKIKAIIDARARRDERINRRRKMEDDAFERFDQDLEEEENNLRRRQKRLKRGLPVEDMGLGSRISSASMSPPGPMYSNVAPPPKRHQTGPPGQNGSPLTSTPRQLPYSAPPPPSSTGPNPPPYAFLQSSHPPPPAPPPASPYGRSPTIPHSPASASGAFQPIPRSHQPSSEPAPSPYAMNGHPPSPHAPRPPVAPGPSLLNTAPPPRQTSSTYDTRPPPPPLPPQIGPASSAAPPAASGFAPINTPPTSGFAAINPRSTATPPAPIGIPLAKGMEYDRGNEHMRPYATEGTPTASTSSISKRTPSSTHPYQMSEAFANRHHHCEKTDHLNRGIWTSYGPGGTKEIPTGPAQEMYLRCNHDGCRRIDWRTVHGLQCHIVKNHEQPKGTIGSLEKALDRYGVPVAEVHEYERKNGDGTGGTMADPKNLKLKTKSRESTDKVDTARKSYGAPSPYGVNPTSLAKPSGHFIQPLNQGSPASTRHFPHEEGGDSESDATKTPIDGAAKPAQPINGFAAVNGGGWSTIPAPRATDHEISNVPATRSVPIPNDTTIKRATESWKTWPDRSPTSKAEPTMKISSPHEGVMHAHGTPAQVPIQPESGVGTDSVRHGSIPSNVVLNAQASVTSPAENLPGQNKEHPPTDTSTKEAAAPIPVQSQPTAFDRPVTPKTESTQDIHMTGTSPQARDSAQVTTLAQEKESVVTGEQIRQQEKPKAEIVEPSRTEPKSPETRRQPQPVRKIASRRSSVAASKAQQEQKEREEAAAAAAKAEEEAERHRRRFEGEDDQDQGEIGQGKDFEKDGDQDKEDDSDDPDTITAAVPSSAMKDKDRDSKTTPRRANGRFVRKRTER